MATLTSTSNFNVSDGPVTVAQTTISIIAAAGVGEGSGRLVHPSLGTYDYAKTPDSWSNVDGDVVIAPIWSSSRTLAGGQDTLWAGHIRDVVVVERWSAKAGLSMTITQLRMLMSMYQTTPDPSVPSHIEWYPSYANELGFKVIIIGLDVGGKGSITLDGLASQGQGFVSRNVDLRMKLVGYV